jgi:ABC-type protease/lipase transport system fused ATPase/permease subunit
VSGGAVMVNGKPLDTYGPADHNRILTYLSADNRLFDGTIQDNVTRFGEVTPEAAYEVARLMGIDKRFDELPGGMQTPVGDSAGGIVPPGLERQIALLRGLSHRPRMILFDHGDQGLDRDGYARLISFFGQMRGTATIVIASEDANLTSLADRPSFSRPRVCALRPHRACRSSLSLAGALMQTTILSTQGDPSPGRRLRWPSPAMATRIRPSSPCWP